MKTVRAGLLALIMTMGSVAMFVPSAGALDVGCQEMGSTGAIVAPPGAGFGVGWAPDCIIIDNGSTVNFGQVDAIGHRALMEGCFHTASLLTSPRAVALSFEDGLLTANGAECDQSSLAQREGCGIGCGTGPELPVVEMGEGQATLWYICSVHGPGMLGRIIVNL